MISVIVPVYNVEKYLEECLDSIQNQTYSDIEVILVNDGSLDKSNGRWIRNLDEQLTKTMADRVVAQGSDDIETILNIDIDAVLNQGKYQVGVDKEEDGMAALNRLVGIGKVKEQVEQFVAMAEFNQKRAEQGIEQAKQAIAERGEASLYTVKAAAQFNGNRSDYAPMLVGQGKEQQLYFTTTRSAVLGNEVSGITAQKNGDVFFVQLDEKGRWKTPEPVVSINTPQDEGAVAFSPDGKTMYLTVCPTHPQ